MPRYIMNREAAASAEYIDPVKLADPINVGNVEIILQSILVGPDPTAGETTNEWIRRLEIYAVELMEEIYS